MEILEKRDPQAIICEMMLPKIDAFRIKEHLNRSVYSKGIPFILLAHEKNERLVSQSLSLGITYFFRKPCPPSEIAGITRLLVSER
jgi:PleD family two-component response regulator